MLVLCSISLFLVDLFGQFRLVRFLASAWPWPTHSLAPPARSTLNFAPITTIFYGQWLPLQLHALDFTCTSVGGIIPSSPTPLSLYSWHGKYSSFLFAFAILLCPLPSVAVLPVHFANYICCCPTRHKAQGIHYPNQWTRNMNMQAYKVCTDSRCVRMCVCVWGC